VRGAEHVGDDKAKARFIAAKDKRKAVLETEITSQA
jgi:hypothetical protein